MKGGSFFIKKMQCFKPELFWLNVKNKLEWLFRKDVFALAWFIIGITKKRIICMTLLFVCLFILFLKSDDFRSVKLLVVHTAERVCSRPSHWSQTS